MSHLSLKEATPNLGLWQEPNQDLPDRPVTDVIPEHDKLAMASHGNDRGGGPPPSPESPTQRKKTWPLSRGSAVVAIRNEKAQLDERLKRRTRCATALTKTPSNASIKVNNRVNGTDTVPWWVILCVTSWRREATASGGPLRRCYHPLSTQEPVPT